MRFIQYLTLFLVSFSLIFPSNLHAYWIWSPTEGKFVKPESTSAEPQKSADELYEYALKIQKSGENSEDAIKELRRLVRQYPDSAYAPEAQFLLATFLEENEKPIQAAQEYQKLIHDFPRSERIDQATENLFNLGKFFLTGEKQKMMGLSIIPVLPKAVEVFQFIIEQAPYGPYGDQAQLNLALAYQKMGKFEESIQTLQTLITNYPTSSLLDEAHYQLAETSYSLSQSANRDQKASTQAADHLSGFIKQYGSSSLAERAQLLKNQLDEQDAEKNYRIGLYYEKQGFVESALIYYEDVTNRYAHTTFGKKAAERYQAVNEPALMMKKGKETVDRRTAEVQTMLQALEKEEKSKKGTNAAAETANTRKQLEAELTTLKLTQKEFKEDSKEKLKERKKALRSREKNLREKFKTFKKRVKSMKKNTAPELAEVFERWETSLIEEQEELVKERQTLSTMGVGVKDKPESAWIPYFGGSRTSDEDKLTGFEEKKWNKLERRRMDLKQARESNEAELANIIREISELEQQEFETAQASPEFEKLLPQDLVYQKHNVSAMQLELARLRENFEVEKKKYEAQFGVEFLTGLKKAEPATSKAVQEMIANGANLNANLDVLQKEKAILSQNWLEAKEQLDTLMKAMGRNSSGSMLEPETSVQGSEDQGKEARILKKRMKFLEREIRSRIDQIVDWQRENAKRTEDLNRLLHPDEKFSLPKTPIMPVRAFYGLFKSFIFGLPNRDKEVFQEAQKEIAKGSESKLSPEQLEAVRKLEEEIALQSILIQGRANEVVQMQKDLAELHEQSKKFPDFEYQSMLADRYPFALSHSLDTARSLVEGESKETVLIDHVNRQTSEIARLEQEIVQINQKIEGLSKAVEQTKTPDPVTETAAGILASLPGGTETLPSSNGTRESEKNKFESELRELNDQLIHAELEYQEALIKYQKGALTWYRGEGKKALNLGSSEGNLLTERVAELSKKQADLQNTIASKAKDEHEILNDQIVFLDEKVEELKKRSTRLEKTEQSLMDTLDQEVKRTSALKESLRHEISLVENLIKN